MKKISWADYMLPNEELQQSLFGEENTNRHNIETLKRIMMEIIRCELSPRQRQVLVLYYFNGLTIPRISEKLGVNKSTVSRTLNRAVSNLRSYLKYFPTR